jgi:hypothetical protein
MDQTAEPKLIRWQGTTLAVVPARYANGQNGIRLFDPETGEPYGSASTSLPRYSQQPDEVFIKNYAENEGLLEVLVKAGIVEDMGVKATAGYTAADICRLLVVPAPGPAAPAPRRPRRKSAAAAPPATGDPEALAYLKKTARLKHQYKAQFQATFGVPLEDYWGDVGGFDIVKFDETFVKPPDGTSTNRAVYERWGAEAVNLVLTVIGVPARPVAEIEAQVAQERETAAREAAL